MKEIKVTGCTDCPLFDREETRCNVSKDLVDYPKTPDNCPLKQQAIIVTL